MEIRLSSGNRCPQSPSYRLTSAHPSKTAKGAAASVVVVPAFKKLKVRQSPIHGCVAGFALKMPLKLSRY
jgi:hypothetical protein